MCAKTPGQCHAITSRDEALARVSDEIAKGTVGKKIEDVLGYLSAEVPRMLSGEQSRGSRRTSDVDLAT
jgi:hypothetical protein